MEQIKQISDVNINNIYGMDEVLGDRCIQLVLEKSDDPMITRLSEDFESNDTIKIIKDRVVSVVQCSLCSEKYLYKEWDNYVE